MTVQVLPAMVLLFGTPSFAQPMNSTWHLLDQSGFVYASGTHLMLNGKKFYFAGTNAYYAASTDTTADDQVRTMFKVHPANGAKVVRCWGFVNGYGGGSAEVSSTPNPIQPSLGRHIFVSLTTYHQLCQAYIERIPDSPGCGCR